MSTETFGIDTLKRLSGLATHGHPILSVYMDLDPSRFPTPAARDAQLRSLLSEAQHYAVEKGLDGVPRDVELIQGMLLADPTIARGADALAIFSCAEAGILDAVRLRSPVEPMAVIDTIPWLEPLAAQPSPGDWAVAVVGRRAARLLRGRPGGLTEFAVIDDDLHRRHAQGGWSQARFQRGIEEQVATHVRGVVDCLMRAHLRRPFQHLVIICSDELRPVIERRLHRELTDVLAGTVDADLEHASADGIASVVAPLIERTERDRERDLIVRLEQALETGGPAAAGLDEVLSMLEQDRVEILLVAERGDLKAGLCPTCGRLWTDDERRCPLDGAMLFEVDAVEHAVGEAARKSLQVVVARHEAEWLTEHGQIAAVLRW